MDYCLIRIRDACNIIFGFAEWMGANERVGGRKAKGKWAAKWIKDRLLSNQIYSFLSMAHIFKGNQSFLLIYSLVCLLFQIARLYSSINSPIANLFVYEKSFYFYWEYWICPNKIVIDVFFLSCYSFSIYDDRALAYLLIPCLCVFVSFFFFSFLLLLRIFCAMPSKKKYATQKYYRKCVCRYIWVTS